MASTARIIEARKAEATDTIEARKAHWDKCHGGLATCDHATSRKNEYGDCYDCDGEGSRMCLCQNWTWEQLGM